MSLRTSHPSVRLQQNCEISTQSSLRSSVVCSVKRRYLENFIGSLGIFSFIPVRNVSSNSTNHIPRLACKNRGWESGAIGTAYYMDAFSPSSFLSTILSSYQIERHDVQKTLITAANGGMMTQGLTLPYKSFMLFCRPGDTTNYEEVAPGSRIFLYNSSPVFSTLTYTIDKTFTISTWNNGGAQWSTSMVLHFIMIIK